MIDYLKLDDAVINHLVDLATNHQPWSGDPKDYCNNPADAWPIILENKISIHNNGMAWKAYKSDRQGAFNDAPLRAAMIVFLMMKDAEIARV